MQVDPKTRERYVVGVACPMERASLVLGGDDVLFRVAEHSFSDLMELAAWLQRYVLGRARVDLEERIERLEKRSRARGRRAA